MQISSGTLAKATGFTGNATFLMNEQFTPELIFFKVSGKVSGDTETHIADGYWHVLPTGSADGTLQASATRSSETRTKTLSHYAGNVEKIGFTVTSVGVGEYTLNFTASNDAYNIHRICIAS